MRVAKQPLRVMVVGPFDGISRHLAAIIDDAPGITVVAKPTSGNLAIGRIKGEHPDVVILDLALSNPDPSAIIPRLRAVDPHIATLLAGHLTFSSVKEGMELLIGDASDFITVPEPSRRLGRLSFDDNFTKDLIARVNALGHAREKAGTRRQGQEKKPIILRPQANFRPEIITIGSSTGGPHALMDIFRRLPATIPQPILVAQHMPEKFIPAMAQNITKSTPWECRVAQSGEEIHRGCIYLAPGGRHLSVSVIAGAPRIKVSDDPAKALYKPSVDVLFDSVATVWGRRALGVVLTGMGADCLIGARAIAEAGGTIIAQDEDTSVVWGMPGVVATDGLCSAVLALNDIPRAIRDIATRPV